MARLRATRTGNEESGFAMIFTLVIIVIVTTSVSAMLVVTASEVKPAQTSVDSASATAAAQAGIQAYTALLNNSAGCAAASKGTSCSALTTNPSLGMQLTGVDGTGQSAYYAVLVNNGSNGASSYTTDGFVRIYSVGCSGPFNASHKCVSPYVAKALVTDFTPPSGYTNLAYYSTYETVGSSLIGQLFPARTVGLPSPTLLSSVSQSVFSLLGGATGGSVSWLGANPAVAAGSYNATQQTCDSEYYNDGNFDLASGGLGRGSTTQALAAFDWNESGTLSKTVSLAGVGTNISVAGQTHYGQCQVALTTSNIFTGPVQSRDAFYLSGTPTVAKASGQTQAGVTTGWGSVTPTYPPAPSAPNTYQTNLTRDGLTSFNSSFNFSGFGASDVKLQTSGSPLLTHSLPAIEPSASFSPINTASSGPVLTNTCVYYGPTRIQLNGNNTATITSPMTLASASNPCYASNTSKTLLNPITYPIDPTTGKAVGSSAPAVVGAVVPLNSNTKQPPTIIVRNVGSSSAWAKTTGDGANLPVGDTSVGTTPIFNIRDDSNLPTTAPAGSGTATNTATPTALWDNTSSVVAGCVPIIFVTTCQANTSAYFDTANKASNSASSTIATLQGTIAATPNSACTNLMAAVAAWNKNLKSPSTTPSSTSDYYYAVSPSTCAAGNGAGTGTGTGTCPSVTQNYAPSAEPLFQANSGTATATCTLTGGGASTTYTVTRYSGVCTGVIVLGACVGVMSWGNTLPQFNVAIANSGSTSYSAWSTTTSATSTFPLTGVTGSSPLLADRTVYNTFDAAGTDGPGDAYIGGQLGAAGTQPLDVITENDTIVTGSITPNDVSGSTAPGSTEPAIALVSGQNVRAYHPVRCAAQYTSLTATASTRTTAGFCPNDTTGLYNYTTLPAPLGSNHPSQQYVNLQQDQTQSGTTCAGITIDGAVYGLGDTATTTASVTNGSLTTDNPDRGVNCGNLTLNGGVFQQHRGEIGTILEDSTATGYSLIYNFDTALQTKLATSWLPPADSSGVGLGWKLVNTSSVPVS